MNKIKECHRSRNIIKRRLNAHKKIYSMALLLTFAGLCGCHTIQSPTMFKQVAHTELEQKPMPKNRQPFSRVGEPLAQLSELRTVASGQKTLNIQVTELTDSSGLVYLGGLVSKAELTGYLAQMRVLLGNDSFQKFRQYQATRDHQSFHLTLVNPYEYQMVKSKIVKAESLRVTLHGLGRVSQGDKSSYFVVASSPDGQFYRQQRLLKNKYFHITLGFYPDDIYGVSKGLETLIVNAM